ncbi:uncharacterized protein J8A68_003501 [[Candida] subhashii]|uniref:Uncharacterized protein n=1 Tax=[Candida] subhashii TaxID=561895 RepID=A0A8J5QDP7_9ASCO|nr:uncharacterized protein J8A68_003501 [[Candida] subhashii]KAG7662991.1 hypothetical protein J8A68_003501 [[Candida] subhashii]
MNYSEMTPPNCQGANPHHKFSTCDPRLLQNTQSPKLSKDSVRGDTIFRKLIGQNRNCSQNSERLSFESRTISFDKLRESNSLYFQNNSMTLSTIHKCFYDQPLELEAIRRPRDLFPTLMDHTPDIEHVRDIIKSVRVQFNQIKASELRDGQQHKSKPFDSKEMFSNKPLPGNYAKASVFGKRKNKSRRIPASMKLMSINSYLVENSIGEDGLDQKEVQLKIDNIKGEIKKLEVEIREDPLNEDFALKKRQLKKELDELLKKKMKLLI